MSDDKKKENPGEFFVVLAIRVGIIAAFVKWIWPSVIPFEYFEFWTIDYSLWEAIKFSWIPFAWGMGVTALAHIFSRNDPDDNRYAEEYMLKGLVVSVRAGVVEEICFPVAHFLRSDCRT